MQVLFEGGTPGVPLLPGVSGVSPDKIAFVYTKCVSCKKPTAFFYQNWYIMTRNGRNQLPKTVHAYQKWYRKTTRTGM